jgi:hypothetical protein
MNYAQYIDLAIILVQETLAALGSKTDAEQKVVADVKAALDALMLVQGTDVTYTQLESLRVQKTF